MGNLTDKVDRIKDELRDDITEIKIDVAEVKSDVKHIDLKIDNTMKVFTDHVTGDNKVITHIEPLIPHLKSIAEMANDYAINKQIKEKRKEFLTSTKLRLSVFISACTAVGIVYKFFW